MSQKILVSTDGFATKSVNLEPDSKYPIYGENFGFYMQGIKSLTQ
jgi:hypothetical protein